MTYVRWPGTKWHLATPTTLLRSISDTRAWLRVACTGDAIQRRDPFVQIETRLSATTPRRDLCRRCFRD